MKLLVVIDGLGTGGSERSLAVMLPAFRRAGIEPIVACSHHRPRGVHGDVEAQGVDVRLLPEGGVGDHLFSGILKRARAVRQIIEAERPALVHTTHFQSNLIGRLAAAGTGVPVLTSLVSTPYRNARLQDPNVTWWKHKIVQHVDAWTARAFNTHFHAVSGAVKAVSVEDMGLAPERITVVERGRDPERLGRPSPERRQHARAKLGLEPGRKVVLSVGRHEFVKGHPWLVEAMERVAEAHPEALLLIAGRDGHTTEVIRRLCRRPALEGRVRLLGHREDVPDLLAAADVFALPSLFEGLPGAVIEAMALGLPIVASNVPALREMTGAGRNALLVPVGEPEAMGNALSTLLRRPDHLRAFGRRSRELFEARFTLERSTAGMIRLYYRVAATDELPRSSGSSNAPACRSAADLPAFSLPTRSLSPNNSVSLRKPVLKK